MAYTDLREYESIRVKYETHKLRHSHHHKLVVSGPGQTLVRSVEKESGFVVFRIIESGIEFPVENVASAIPKGVTLAAKLQKTTGSRLTKKVPAKRARDEDDDGEA